MENNPIFVLLAGGKSERMGVDKGLLKYKQTYWVLEQLHRISKSAIKDVYIAFGYNYQHYFRAIPWLKNAQNYFVEYNGLNIKVIINKNPELGSFSTLQTVLKIIPKSTDVLVNHIDIPLLNSEGLTKIISQNNEVVQPNFEGKNGHPIKLSSNFWRSLCELNLSDKNSRLDYQIKKINPTNISTIKVFDQAVIMNLNTKKDWKAFLNRPKI